MTEKLKFVILGMLISIVFFVLYGVKKFYFEDSYPLYTAKLTATITK